MTPHHTTPTTLTTSQALTVLRKHPSTPIDSPNLQLELTADPGIAAIWALDDHGNRIDGITVFDTRAEALDAFICEEIEEDSEANWYDLDGIGRTLLRSCRFAKTGNTHWWYSTITEHEDVMSTATGFLFDHLRLRWDTKETSDTSSLHASLTFEGYRCDRGWVQVAQFDDVRLPWTALRDAEPWRQQELRLLHSRGIGAVSADIVVGRVCG